MRRVGAAGTSGHLCRLHMRVHHGAQQADGAHAALSVLRCQCAVVLVGWRRLRHLVALRLRAIAACVNAACVNVACTTVRLPLASGLMWLRIPLCLPLHGALGSSAARRRCDVAGAGATVSMTSPPEVFMVHLTCQDPPQERPRGAASATPGEFSSGRRNARVRDNAHSRSITVSLQTREHRTHVRAF